MSKFERLEQHTPNYSGFPCADAKDYEGMVFPDDVESFRNKLMNQYFDPFRLEVPGYVLKQLAVAANTQPEDRELALEKARQKAELAYLTAWANGKIKVGESKPMPEDVKQKLKELNQKRREARAEYQQSNKINKIGMIDTTVTATITPKSTGQKLPVFKNLDAQKAARAKYPWIIDGTFKQDPEKDGGTIVDIKCQKCGASRTIHMADAFQVKLCLNCKRQK